mgnify:CR=1 FL=1
MEVGLFVLGVLVGVGLAWYLLERYRRDENREREANFSARLATLQEELRQSDAALAETKERLIALQMEFRATEARAKPLEAELAQAKRAAEQAIEQEMKQRRLLAELQERLAGGTPEPAAPPQPAAVEAPAASATAPNQRHRRMALRSGPIRTSVGHQPYAADGGGAVKNASPAPTEPAVSDSSRSGCMPSSRLVSQTASSAPPR